MLLLILAFALAEILLVVDMLQTRYISKNPAKFSEINIILGPQPRLIGVNIYFAVWLIGTAVAACYGLLVVLAMIIVLELITTIRNYNMGIRFA